MKKCSLVVTAPVADLMGKPVEEEDPDYDNLRETQLLFNETLICRDEVQGWHFVEALEQKKLLHGNILSGYPGWIKKEAVALPDKILFADAIVSKTGVVPAPAFTGSAEGPCLPAGARLRLNGESAGDLVGFHLPGGEVGWTHKDNIIVKNTQESSQKKRERVISAAMSFIGTPYLWGGRSTFMPSYEYRTGMDCSGFTNLAYRIGNIDIPRNAHDQWKLSRKVSPDELKTADLIFLSLDDHKDRVTHVMLFLDEERFIEAAETGLPAGIRTFREKFGRSWKDIVENHSVVGNTQVHCGSFIQDE